MQTKLIQFFTLIFSFLFCLFSLLGCDKFEEYQKNRKERIRQEIIEKDKRVEREKVERAKKFSRKANINGVPVVLPSGVGGLEIDGDPPFLSPKKRETPRPDSSYENSVRSFGFEFEFKKNIIRNGVKNDEYIGDKKYYAKDFLNPQGAWVHVILTAGERSPKVTMNKFANNMLERYERSRSGWEAYMQTGELFGLEWYQAHVPISAHPKVKQSMREKRNDVFIQKDENGDVITVIRCSNTKDYKGTTDFQHCDQHVQLADLNAWLELSYLRVHLEQWQEIQRLAEEHIRSWIVEPKQVQ